MSLSDKLALRLQRSRHIQRLMRRYHRKRRWKRWHRAKKRLEAQLRAIRKLRRAIRRQPGLQRVKVNLGNWGGSGSVMDQFIEPFMQKRGLPLGSGKRTPSYNAAIGGSPNSDHLTTHTTTDARDFPTYSGADDAIALARALGQSSWYPGTYNLFNITVGGVGFRVQILWAVSGHYDHVHVGVSRA